VLGTVSCKEEQFGDRRDYFFGFKKGFAKPAT
jgi:hypothetical protein